MAQGCTQNPGYNFDNLAICNSQGVYKVAPINPTVLNKNFTIYPNPATNYLKFDYTFDKEETGIFTIYNMVGMKLSSQQLKDKTSIEISNLVTGFYTYKFVSSLGKIYEGKLIID